MSTENQLEEMAKTLRLVSNKQVEAFDRIETLEERVQALQERVKLIDERVARLERGPRPAR